MCLQKKIAEKEREKLTEKVHLREDYVRFIAETSLSYVVHV